MASGEVTWDWVYRPLISHRAITNGRTVGATDVGAGEGQDIKKSTCPVGHLGLRERQKSRLLPAMRWNVDVKVAISHIVLIPEHFKPLDLYRLCRASNLVESIEERGTLSKMQLIILRVLVSIRVS